MKCTQYCIAKKTKCSETCLNGQNKKILAKV